jgi:hypothetical protein
MAGPTIQANSPIGTVTEAQMAKIFDKEYCLELAGVSRCAGSDCVFVMPSSHDERWFRASAAGLEITRSGRSLGRRVSPPAG